MIGMAIIMMIINVERKISGSRERKAKFIKCHESLVYEKQLKATVKAASHKVEKIKENVNVQLIKHGVNEKQERKRNKSND